jgi:hypothetical protein
MFKERFLAYIKKEDGKTRLVFTDNGKSLEQRLSILPEGKELLVTIETKHDKRSEAQNNLYWLYVDIIANELGYRDKEVLHELFKKKFLTVGQENIFIPKHQKNYKLSKTIPSKSLNKAEFIEYMYKIEDLTGIPIPETDAWKSLL